MFDRHRDLATDPAVSHDHIAVFSVTPDRLHQPAGSLLATHCLR